MECCSHGPDTAQRDHFTPLQSGLPRARQRTGSPKPPHPIQPEGQPEMSVSQITPTMTEAQARMFREAWNAAVKRYSRMSRHLANHRQQGAQHRRARDPGRRLGRGQRAGHRPGRRAGPGRAHHRSRRRRPGRARASRRPWRTGCVTGAGTGPPPGHSPGRCPGAAHSRSQRRGRVRPRFPRRGGPPRYTCTCTACPRRRSPWSCGRPVRCTELSTNTRRTPRTELVESQPGPGEASANTKVN